MRIVNRCTKYISIRFLCFCDKRIYRIVREDTPILCTLPAAKAVCDRVIDCPDPKKLLLPHEGVEELGTRQVVWSDLDGNGHLYSANYGDIIWDYLPCDLQERTPREFYINYNHEATLGETLRLVGFRNGDGSYLMEALGPDAACFTALCVF